MGNLQSRREERGNLQSRRSTRCERFPSIRISPEEKRDKKKLEWQLKDDFKKECGIVKLLLLGTGESGKSTILKQMKLIHLSSDHSAPSFTEKEKFDAKVAIYLNIVDAMVALIEGINQLSIKGLDVLVNNDGGEERINYLANKVLSYGSSIRYAIQRITQVNFEAIMPNGEVKYCLEESEVHFEEIMPNEEEKYCLKEMWSSQTLQEVYARRNELQVSDSTYHFMSSMDRIYGGEYIPTNEDILRARVKTTGVVRIEFTLQLFQKNVPLHILDVGGQRSEREKWIKCFDNVTCVFYVISVSEYDQVLEEDKTTNRMAESLNLFGKMLNHNCFLSTSFVVFFNKSDLFVEKIKAGRGIKIAFPDYEGAENSSPESLEFIINKYLSVNTVSSYQRMVYHHTTTATDTNLIKKISDDVLKMIINSLPLF